MSDLGFKRNMANGKMGILWNARNDATFDDTEQHAVMACLVIARAKWWADTQGTIGSRLAEVKTITASDGGQTTKSQVEAYAREALALLIKAGRIVLHKVSVTVPDRGRAGQIVLAVYWSARGGPEQETRIFV